MNKKIEITDDDYELIISALELYDTNYGHIASYDESMVMTRKIEILKSKFFKEFEK